MIANQPPNKFVVSFDRLLNIQYDPVATKVLGYDVWRIVNGFRAYLTADKSAWKDIKPGFLSDGASIPRVFRNIYTAWSWYGQAAVLHDGLCESLTYETTAGTFSMTRDDCDRCFLAGMLDCYAAAGASEKDCDVLFSAVRAYALVTRTTQPSATAKKLALDAQWPVTC
jgi:hypothetical protein